MSNALNHERLINVLVGPHVSEKASVVAERNNQVTFKVRIDSTKSDIKKAKTKDYIHSKFILSPCERRLL